MNRTKAAFVLYFLWLALLWPADRLLAYRDLETGTFLTRDPAGMVDGPNLYAYVNQNPWTKFDPDGLSAYSDLVDSAAGDLAQDHYVSGYSKATLAATWEALSFHSASRNGAVGDAYDAGNLSAGQAAMQYTANTASAAKDAALTYGTGGVVGKAAQAYARAEAVVDTGEALANGDVKGAALSSLALILGRGGNPSGKSAAVVSQESRLATEVAEEAQVAQNQYRGGPHGEMTKPVNDRLDSHHMPDRHADPNVSANNGPAIQMDPLDHAATSSNGRNGTVGAIYREQTAEMIAQGRYRDVMAREIKDVRRAAGEVSGNRTKYNGAVREMLDYTRSSGQLPVNPRTGQ